MNTPRIGHKNAKHTFEVGTTAGKVTVDADNRRQARALATLAGYTVRDVNMVG